MELNSLLLPLWCKLLSRAAQSAEGYISLALTYFNATRAKFTCLLEKEPSTLIRNKPQLGNTLNTEPVFCQPMHCGQQQLLPQSKHCSHQRVLNEGTCPVAASQLFREQHLFSKVERGLLKGTSSQALISQPRLCLCEKAAAQRSPSTFESDLTLGISFLCAQTSHRMCRRAPWIACN